MIIDTATVQPGTYLLYTSNLNYLSNNQEDFGGMMTEIVINVSTAQVGAALAAASTDSIRSDRRNLMKVKSKTKKPGVLAFLLLLAAGIAWAQMPMEMPGMIDGVGTGGLRHRRASLSADRQDRLHQHPRRQLGVRVGLRGQRPDPDPGPVQYPGPTLLVNQGDVVRVDLTNDLPVPVSIVFPGSPSRDGRGGRRPHPGWAADPGGHAPGDRHRTSFPAGR